MAAFVIIPTEAQWAVLEEILNQVGEGAIIVPPEVVASLKQQGLDLSPLDLIDYDFGGEADIFIDVMRDENHFAIEAIKEHLSRKTE